MWMLLISFILMALGFLLPFWPLGLLGILLAAASGRYIAAIAMGLLLDVAFGAPVGRWSFLYVPFTLFAAATSALRYYLSSYFRDDAKDTL
jgi:hypothetical protein